MTCQIQGRESFFDLGLLMGTEFKKLSEEELQVWQDKVEKNKKRYQEEMANYSAPEDSSSDSDDDSEHSDDAETEK